MVESLTEREAETVALVAEGLTNREIAVRMTVTWRTVRTHVHHAMAKTGSRNRVELTLWAQKNGIAVTPTLAAHSGWLFLRALRKLADDHEEELRGG